MDPEGGAEGPDPSPPGKSQVVIGFRRNTGTDPLEKQYDCFWSEVCTALYKIS